MDFFISPDPGLVIWTTVSFGLLFYVLKKFAWGPILTSIELRNENIEQSLMAAEKAKSEVQDLAKLRREMMDEAKNERDELLKETRELKEQILAEARSGANQEADRIINSARKQIETEKSAAIRELKKQVAELSVDIAGLLLESELKEDHKQKAIIDKYLNDVNFN